MSGFWSSETMQRELPRLIKGFRSERIVNCAYEMSLGEEVVITGESKGATIKEAVRWDSQISIPPGQFAALLTGESIKIPCNAIGFISMKFKIKQRGLVNVSGFHVDPGYSGKLLFSVYNAGPRSIVLTRGEPVFLLWICYLDEVTKNPYEGPNRTSITSEDVNVIQGDIASPQALARRVGHLETTVKIQTWVAGALATALIAALVSAIVAHSV